MEQANIVNYKCPNCAAPLVYDIQKAGWDCHFCSSFFSKEELDKIEAVEGTEETYQASWTVEAFDEQDMLAYTCPDCGGRVIADKNTAASFCSYCHNPTVLASQLQGEFKPAKILPFKVPKDAVLAELRKLIKGKPFLPKSFKDCVEKGEITGLYVPFWLFSSDVSFDLAGEAITTRVWSDSHYNYKQTNFYEVARKGVAEINHVPVDASSRMEDQLMDAIEPYNYNELSDFSMQYLSGHFADTYDVNAAESFDRFSLRAGGATRNMVQSSLSGYQMVTNRRYDIGFNNRDNLYVMLPVWTAAVKYSGKIYTFAMNGQTGKSAGKLPTSIKKMWLIFLGLGAVFSAIAMAIGFIAEASI